VRAFHKDSVEGDVLQSSANVVAALEHGHLRLCHMNTHHVSG
jgi:hypothetical protein